MKKEGIGYIADVIVMCSFGDLAHNSLCAHAGMCAHTHIYKKEIKYDRPTVNNLHTGIISLNSGSIVEFISSICIWKTMHVLFRQVLLMLMIPLRYH